MIWGLQTRWKDTENPWRWDSCGGGAIPAFTDLNEMFRFYQGVNDGVCEDRAYREIPLGEKIAIWNGKEFGKQVMS